MANTSAANEDQEGSGNKRLATVPDDDLLPLLTPVRYHFSRTEPTSWIRQSAVDSFLYGIMPPGLVPSHTWSNDTRHLKKMFSNMTHDLRYWDGSSFVSLGNSMALLYAGRRRPLCWLRNPLGHYTAYDAVAGRLTRIDYPTGLSGMLFIVWDPNPISNSVQLKGFDASFSEFGWPPSPSFCTPVQLSARDSSGTLRAFHYFEIPEIMVPRGWSNDPKEFYHVPIRGLQGFFIQEGPELVRLDTVVPIICRKSHPSAEMDKMLIVLNSKGEYMCCDCRAVRVWRIDWPTRLEDILDAVAVKPVMDGALDKPLRFFDMKFTKYHFHGADWHLRTPTACPSPAPPLLTHRHHLFRRPEGGVLQTFSYFELPAYKVPQKCTNDPNEMVALVMVGMQRFLNGGGKLGALRPLRNAIPFISCGTDIILLRNAQGAHFQFSFPDGKIFRIDEPRTIESILGYITFHDDVEALARSYVGRSRCTEIKSE